MSDTIPSLSIHHPGQSAHHTGIRRSAGYLALFTTFMVFPTGLVTAAESTPATDVAAAPSIQVASSVTLAQNTAQQNTSEARREARRERRQQNTAAGSAADSSRSHPDRVTAPFSAITASSDLDANEKVGPIVFANERPSQVISLLERFTGKVVLLDSNLPKVQLSFNSSGQLRRDEAIFALENLLALNGIYLSEVDERFIKAVPSANISTRGTPIIDEIPDGVGAGSEQYFARIFHFDNLNSREASQQLNPLLSRGNRSSIINFTRSNSLMVVDTLSNLRRIQEVVERIDQPSTSNFEVFFFPIENVSAYQVRLHLLQLQRTSHRDQMASNTINVDSRTNQLVVSTLPANRDFYERIINNLDTEITPATTSHVFYLKNAQSAQVYRIINQIVRNQQRIFDRLGLRSVNMYRTETVLRPAAQQQTDEPVAEGSEEATAQPLMETVDIDIEDTMMQDGMPELQFSQFINVIPDNSSNALVVYGTPLDIERVGALIAELDVDTVPLTSSRIVYLHHAPANRVSSAISTIIRHQQNLFRRQGVAPRDGRPASSEAAPLESEGDLEFSPYATVVADTRSNALLLYGTTSDQQKIETLIQSLDVDVAPKTNSETFFLQHADANQLARVVAAIISNQRSSFQRQGFITEQTSGGVAQDENENAAFLGNEELRFSPYATVVADARSNAIIAYGTTADLRRISTIVTETDIPVAPLTSSRVFILSHADAQTLQRTLQTIITGQRRALTRVASSAVRNIRNASEGGLDITPGDVSLGMQFSPYITITADRRSNSIIAYGTQRDLTQIEELINATDIHVAPLTTSEVFTIKHGSARDITRTIVSIITSQQRIRQRESSERRVFLRAGDFAGDEEDIALATGALPAAGSPADDVVLVDAPSSLLEIPDTEWTDDLQFSQYVSVVADDRSNSIVAYGTDKDLTQIKDMIDKVDVVLAQVRIEVVIAEVALIGEQVSGLETFGINYLKPAPGSNNPGDINIGTGSPTIRGTQSPAFSFNASLNPFSLSAVFNVAKDDRNVKILSAPTIVTTHNQRATVNVGEARPIITSSTSSLASSDLTTRSTVEYRDIGITLQVRPLIGDNNVVQMEIEQIVETVISTQQIDGNEQPIIGTRRATSFISIDDEEVIVLAGLQSTESTRQRGKVWLLGDIPILGELFSPRSNSETVRELIIFIKPHIVRTSNTAATLTAETLDSRLIGPDVKEFIETGQFKEQRAIIDRFQQEEQEEKEKQELREQFQETPTVPARRGRR